MQNELRVYSKANFVPNGSNQSYSGIYRKTSNPTESLLIASREGKIEKVKELLDSGLDPEITVKQNLLRGFNPDVNLADLRNTIDQNEIDKINFKNN